MSYMMFITGDEPNIKGIEGVKFVKAEQSQDYIKKIINGFPSQDVAKTYFVDDGSLTSHDLVNEGQEPLNMGQPFTKTRLSKFLQACYKVNCRIRIWWAGNDLEAFKKVAKFDNKEHFEKELVSKLMSGQDINLLYEPKNR